MKHKYKKDLEIINQIKQVNASDYKTWHYLRKAYFDINKTNKAIEAFEFAELLVYCGQANYLSLIMHTNLANVYESF